MRCVSLISLSLLLSSALHADALASACYPSPMHAPSFHRSIHATVHGTVPTSFQRSRATAQRTVHQPGTLSRLGKSPSHFQSGRHGCELHMMASKASASASDSKTSDETARRLLRECAKEERSIPLLNELVAALETSSKVQAEKPKRALLGDWKLAFASDADAAAVFTTGQGGGVFSVVECALLRLQKSNVAKVIEVSRRFGPFGNEKRSLSGKWGVVDGTFRLRYTSMLNVQREEEAPPQHAAVSYVGSISHVSPRCLVLRLVQNDEKQSLSDVKTSGSFVVFCRLPKGVDPELSELQVETEDK
uniref:Plastid lipid-associated protein/fibrillin conserved domain-containing protein n=1 Tax=Chrysotila carterae TaxID=13221 RepID=A0A7S4F6U1_CHRCT